MEFADVEEIPGKVSFLFVGDSIDICIIKFSEDHGEAHFRVVLDNR